MDTLNERRSLPTFELRSGHCSEQNHKSRMRMAALNERGSLISSVRSLYRAQFKIRLQMAALNERGSRISSFRSMCSAQIKN